MSSKIIALFLLGFSIAACKKANRFDCIKRSGEIQIELRSLANFDIIEVQNNIDVLLIQDSVCYVEVEAGKNLMANIESSVVGNKLLVKNNNRCNYTRSYNHDIKIYIHFKKLNELIYEGTGPITSLNTIQNDKFTLNSWDGTDTINLMLDVPLVYANIHTGVADLIVSGKSEQLFAYAKGSGTFRMQAFKCTNVYTNNVTSSDHYFWAEKKIEALVQYVGNTYYKGNPTEIVKTINNQGKLIQVQ
jgi:hypothetical protein